MRRALLLAYLAVYYLLVAGAVATLWRAGLIEHLHRGWTLGAVGGAIALGALLFALSRK